ncbi:hypothetical protein AURDEDRAFT_156663 [Auricularia subglabra TFB-10046 SS5]|nr:hypothetical protein AURDEDRAFT_156663 [Auricularia subglabra TFB-10046 SS5]
MTKHYFVTPEDKSGAPLASSVFNSMAPPSAPNILGLVIATLVLLVGLGLLALIWYMKQAASDASYPALHVEPPTASDEVVQPAQLHQQQPASDIMPKCVAKELYVPSC